MEPAFHSAGIMTSITEQFDRVVSRNPHATAIVAGDAEVTYLELQSRAHRVARFLMRRSPTSLGRDRVVAVQVDRSIETVVGILAVLKTGAAYLPLDPELPEARIQYLLSDASPCLLVTSRSQLPATREIAVFCVEDAEHEDPEPVGLPEVMACDLAYIIYTSGSTGEPKGVMIEHRGVVNMALAQHEHLGAGPLTRVLQFYSFAFDASVFETFMALLNGGCLILAPREHLLDSRVLKTIIQERAVTSLQLPPAILAGLDARELPGVSTVMVGGEVYPLDMVARWAAGRRLFNVYGPTEATCWSTYHEYEGHEAPIPIGRPIHGVELHLLDEGQRPVGQGQLGEIHIGGVGLARGYVGRSDLTAERFVTLMLPGAPHSVRLYRTGDLARLSGGELIFAGRADHQIKLRGYRVELAEIESVLQRHPLVRRCVCVASTPPGGEAEITAHVMGREGASGVDEREMARELRTHARLHLPSYMVPTGYSFLAEFPLLPNDKVDRRALPAASSAHRPTDSHGDEPRTAGERLVAEIWRGVLGYEGAIGTMTNFLDVGGHSLNAVRVQARLLERLGKAPPLRAFFENPTLSAIAAAVDATGAAEEFVDQEHEADWSTPTAAQRQLWFVEEQLPASAIYNEPMAIRLQGAVDFDALQMAIEGLQILHPSLGTRLDWVDGELLQSTASPIFAALDRQQIDGDALPLALIEHAREAFDLEHGPLFRARLYERDHEDFVLSLVFHHMVTDGWSAGILVRDLRDLYVARLGGPPLPSYRHASYAGYGHWQAAWLGTSAAQRAREYWRERLASAKPLLELPSASVHPPRRSGKGGRVPWASGASIYDGLTRLARRHEASPFMILFAAFAALLSRLTRERDIVVGTVSANRDLPRFKNTVGLFANTIPIRIGVSPEDHFHELVGRTRCALLDAHDHCRLPFEEIVKSANPARSNAHLPVVQVMMVFQEGPTPLPRLPGVVATEVTVHTGASKFDLLFELHQSQNGYEGWLEFNADILDVARARRIVEQYDRLLDSAISDSHAIVGRLALTDDEDLQALAMKARPLADELEWRGSLEQDFAERARHTPAAIAVVAGREHMSYGELDRRASILAGALRAVKVGRDVIVGLLAVPNVDTVTAILAIHRAGGAYLPLDPSHPPERLARVFADSGSRVLVSHGDLATWAPSGVTLIDVRRIDWAELELPRGEWPEVAADDLAYVIYTSGTTGRPKGACISHRNLARLFDATERCFDFTADDRWSLFHSFAFDFSVWEMWGALRYGGRMVLVPPEVRRAPDAFWRLLVEEEVTVLSQTPSAFYQLAAAAVQDGVDTRPKLRHVVFGGERLDFDRLRQWMVRFGDSDPVLVNMYGITETTVHVTHRRITAKDIDDSASLIGDPLVDLAIALVEESGELAPTGVPGEILVAGGGVCRGYLDRPELTEQRFITWGRDGQRWYRSGDLALRRENGDLVYLGRIDQQVQLRGFRIELGEIEFAIRDLSGVLDVAVVLHEETDRESSRLIAYIVPDENMTLGDLRASLSRRLPDYMVPSSFVTMDRLPLTANGKLDRSALPPPSVALTTGIAAAPPETALEHRLVRIWQDVLGQQDIGVSDDFFMLGGHSLLATMAALRLRHELGLAAPVRLIFEHPTIRELAAALANGSNDLAGESRPDLEADLRLPTNITSPGRCVEWVPDPSAVLLTGGTGFLGAHLLRELLNRTRATIYCLVRASDDERAFGRIRNNVAAHQLAVEGIESRVRVIVGDLCKPRLGMSMDQYSRLSEQVDIVYHGGAAVNFLEPYGRIARNNVEGTRHVLEFAVEGKRKPIHLISSTAVFGTLGYFKGDTRFLEDEGIERARDFVFGGYACTKWVSEQLAWAAARNGLPVSVYRCGLILGASESGIGNNSDYISRLIKGCIQLEAVFDLPGKRENFIPVDVAAAGIVAASLRSDSRDRAFHVVNPHEVLFRDFWDILRARGYRLDELSFDEWVQRLVAHARMSRGNALYPLIPLFLEKVSDAQRTIVELFQDTPRFDTARFERCLADAGLECPSIDSSLVGRWLSHYQRSGFIDPPPVRT
jgi:amino acid adenylation domain-containing protein/thioester reductase-like protein